MISQGSIQQHTYEFEREGTTSAELSFRVTAQMVPRAKVLGVFSGEDGELVADLIEVPVACSLPNQVRWLLLVLVLVMSPTQIFNVITYCGMLPLKPGLDGCCWLLVATCDESHTNIHILHLYGIESV